MNRFTLVEKELMQVNDAKFQIICNAYLSQEYKGDLQSPGAVEGKEKTRKGKPDAFILLSDGDYILAEYTTKDQSKKSAFNEKLNSDLKDCLDVKSLGIQISQVNTIVLCCNSIVSTVEIEKLKTLTNPFGIALRIVGITKLALFLTYNPKGKLCAKEYLGVPFDTGQILSKDDFIRQYGKNKLATPLDTTMIGREQESLELVKAIRENDVVIVKGAAGVGKSRLVLHVMDQYLKSEGQCIAYCIMKKSGSIIEDLLTSLDTGGKYLLLVDDANRQIDNLMATIIKKIEENKIDIKIIATVRDYAKEDVIKACRSQNPKVFQIEKLNDGTIAQIIKGNGFAETEESIITRIIQVSSGNPRLAFMAQQVILKNGDANALNDVSSLYDEYFQSLIDDKELFSDIKIQKTLGILSYFHTLDMEDDHDKGVIKSFGIPYETFVEKVHLLEELEIVEVFMKYTVKISEQVMSTYIFYRVFIKDKSLSFSLLLNNYFENYSRRMNDSFESAYSSFGKGNVLEQVKQELMTYLKGLVGNDEKTSTFFNIFGKHLPTQVFLFVSESISKLPILLNETNQYSDFINHSGYFEFESKLYLIKDYYASQNLIELNAALDITIKYVIKKPASYGFVLKELKEAFVPDIIDLENSFLRQKAIYKYTTDRLIQSEIFVSLLYHLFGHIALKNHYDNSFYIKVNEKWELKQSFIDIRELFWLNLKDNFQSHKNKILNLLIVYLDEIEHSNIVLICFDLKHLVSIFTKYFNSDNFEDCYYVNEYYIAVRKKKILSKELDTIIINFSSSNYLIFLKLIFNRIDYYDLLVTFNNEEDISLYKEDFIKKNFIIKTIEDFIPINLCINEVMNCRYKSKIGLVEAIDLLIGNTLDADPSIGFEVLHKYLHAGNQAKYWPVKTYKSIFKLPEIWHSKLYKAIYEIDFNERSVWQERYFFYLLPENLTTETTIKLLDLYKSCDSVINLNAKLLDKFIFFDQNIHKKVLSLLAERRNKNKIFKYALDHNFFSNHSFLIQDDFEFCKMVYFQQEDIDSRYDLDCKEMIVFLNHNDNFFYDYISFLYAKSDPITPSYSKHFRELWILSNTEDFVYQALHKINNTTSYYGSDNIASAFFIGLKEKNTKRASLFLQKLILDYKEDSKILNLVFDIARNYMKDYYHVLIREFLTLNSNLSIFKKIRWLNNHFSCNDDSIWADFKVMELQKLHTTIQQLPNQLNYLPHLNEIEQWIEREQRESVREQKMRYRGFR